MPLRDHFRPPLDNSASWEELHGGWPMVLVQYLHRKLPSGYVAGPRVHTGSQIKDRPEHRNAFVGKCAALLQKGVAVSIVDLVTVRQFNLYAELLAFMGHNDPTLGDPPPHTYATSCRWVKKEKRTILEAWSHVLTVGQSLPTLPLWLAADLVVPLDLEQSYEQACHDLWIA